MKKITFLTAIVLMSAIVNAQYSCANAVVLTNGFTANNITTPGAGAGSPAAWVTSSIDCQGTGGYSSNLAFTTTCWNQVFDTIGDDYMFQYTTGANAGESVFFEIVSRQSYVGLMAFTDCTGTALNGCLSGAYTANVGTGTATLHVSASNLPANQTVYFGIGVWSTPNNLDFDVTNFTVTQLGVGDFNQNKMSIYPNPVTDVLNIGNITGMADVSIYNLLGQEVFRKSGIDDESHINVSGLSSGTYLVKVTVGEKMETFKIIKE
ncbi:MAG TPA: T9SS type A sorting domain-containing protein [Flavobacterium sp.]|nr:T9SS type A sorting domain-containing protein [Flavobacterium sp.]